MPLTAQLGTADSQPGNIEPGLNGVIPPLATISPPSLVVEVAWDSDPITTAGYYYNDLNDGPVGYWRMDNQTSLIDQTGSGNNMTVTGSPTLTSSLVAGDTNQATIFDGVNDGASAPSTPSISPTGPFTLETPIRTPSSMPGSTAALISKRGSFKLELLPSGKLAFTVKKGILVNTVTSISTLATSTTYFVACVYDGTQLLIYLNGALDAQLAYSGGVEATASPLELAGVSNSSVSPAYATNAFKGEGGSAGIGINKPSGTADGDYLVAQLLATKYTSGLPTIASVPAGWTLLGSVAGSDAVMYAYGKVAASEPSGWGWGFSDTGNLVGSVSRYTGVGAVPVGTVATGGPSSGTTVSASALPAFDNTMVVSLFGGHLTSSTGTWTGSGAGTERLDYAPSQSESIAIYTQAVGAAAVTSVTGTSSVSGQLLAIELELVGALTSSTTAIMMDEVSLFAVGLTPAQILRHYQEAVTPPPTLTWTDITADVKSVQTSRGRQYELNRMEAGTATLLLNDDQRNYDPANNSSIYAPNVIPMRQLRISASFAGLSIPSSPTAYPTLLYPSSGTGFPLFHGYVERWESRWSTGWAGSHAECEVTAVDGFEPLALTVPTGSVQASFSGSAISSILGKANWPSDRRNLDQGAFQVSALTLDGSSNALDYIHRVAEGEAGVFFINGSGIATFHDKNHRITATTSTTSQATFGDQTLAALPYTGLAPSKDKDHIVNDWTVTDADGNDHHATDTDSQNRYFKRSSASTTFLSSADAATMADYRLSVTAEPGYRFDTIQLIPNTTAQLWEQALTREIGDRITVQRQPVALVLGTQIEQDCWIERVEWTATPFAPWTVNWQLSPAS